MNGTLNDLKFLATMSIVRSVKKLKGWHYKENYKAFLSIEIFLMNFKNWFSIWIQQMHEKIRAKEIIKEKKENWMKRNTIIIEFCRRLHEHCLWRLRFIVLLIFWKFKLDCTRYWKWKLWYYTLKCYIKSKLIRLKVYRIRANKLILID